MNIIVVTQVRLMGDGLAACFARHEGMNLCAIVNDLSILRDMLATTAIDLVLIDVSQGIELYDVRSIAAEHPEVSLVALGLNEQRQEVIRCGQAGFSGYIARDTTAERLCDALSDVVNGRLACSAEISNGLLRALFSADRPAPESPPEHTLTRRESDVLQLIGQGGSNKEIARELNLSVATVKHHVHNVLDKLQVSRRGQAMRKVRDAPWLVDRLFHGTRPKAVTSGH